jgi:cell division topological specificity factor
MFEFFTRLFRGEPSGAKAKERLRLVLLSDHIALAPDVIEALKTDLLEVISRYVEVDIEHVDVTFEQREHEVAMLASVPILSMKNPHERHQAVAPAGRPEVARVASEGDMPAAVTPETGATGAPPAEALAAPRASETPGFALEAEASPPADLPLNGARKSAKARRRRRRKTGLSVPPPPPPSASATQPPA